MREPHLDQQLIHNSSLSCFLIAYFIFQYQQEKSSFVLDLPKLLTVLPLTWNEENREIINKRNAKSRIDDVLSNFPSLVVDLKSRFREHTPTTLQGINLAASSQLIRITEPSNLQEFMPSMKRWPKGIKKSIPLSMIQTIERLAKWLAMISTEELYKLLFGAAQ
ncbi:three component ABC system middle component [Pseudomonas oryzihabitans]|uniref:three component ABC system middle component n=1 Tax=Pseudomonas oryzihabitans TaxID=47885 RepID=UPI003CEE7A30